MAQVHMPGLVCANCCAGIPGQGGVPEACTIYHGNALCFACLGRAKYGDAGGPVVPRGVGGSGGARIMGGGGTGSDDAPPFPPHNPDFPDVDPATGDERATTEGEAA